MGICSGKEAERNDVSSFSFEELEQMKQIYSEISRHDQECASQNGLNRKSMQCEFPENSELAGKIFDWMHRNSGDDLLYFPSYAQHLEMLISDTDQQNRSLKEPFPNRLVLTTLISIGRIDLNRKQCLIDYNQGEELLREILRAFNRFELKNTLEYDQAATCLAEAVFSESQKKPLDLKTFAFLVERQLIYVNRLLKVYYSSKFINKKLGRSLETPCLDSSSHILTHGLLSLLFLSSEQFQKTEKLTLLYSMSTHGSSFNGLAYAIKGYDGPTLILLKHVDQSQEGKANNPQVFGGFNGAAWEEDVHYHGQSNCFVFSLVPKFRTYPTYEGAGGQSYLYFNSRKPAHSKHKVGLGFGGIKYEGFRVWVDEDMERESYTNPEDDTYARGYLTEPSVRKFDIRQIEIWGLGGTQALESQARFREEERVQIEKSRKVDRAAYGNSDFDKEMFFEKTYASAMNREDRHVDH